MRLGIRVVVREKAQMCSFERREEFQKALRSAVVSDHWFKSLIDIYLGVLKRFPDVEVSYPFDRAEGLMENWKNEIFLQTPMTLKEYTRMAMSETWESILTEWNDVKMSVHTVQTLDERTWATVFADYAYLQLFTEFKTFSCVLSQIDSNFVPKVERLLTISVLVSNEWWPISWALIEKSTSEAFSTIFEVLNSVHGIMLEPSRIVITEFDTDLADSIERFFPSTSTVCTMTLTEKLDSMKGPKYTENMLKKNPRTGRYFRKLNDLVYLPPKAIKNEFQVILESAGNVSHSFLKELLDHYQEWWLDRITPERFSLFGHDDIQNSKVAAHLSSIDLPDIEKWAAVFKPFNIWKFTGNTQHSALD